jgi:ATP-binding cassette, subfamily B, bacterial
MLTGVYRDFGGNIFLENLPLQNYTLQSLRNQTGILLNLQDIFRGRLIDNITMGNPNITISEITALAEKLGFINEMQSLYQGFETIMDPTGKRVSKKVLQQILLMRALLGQHRLLLLEDPCNHLNAGEKAAVLKCLKEELAATVIISTNDLDVAMNCDKIFILKEGSIEKSGTWNELRDMIFD